MQVSTLGAGATAPTTDELIELMEEPPGGANYGRAAVGDPQKLGGRTKSLSLEGAQVRELMQDGGWTIFDPAHRGVEAGMTAHRTTLHEDEYVDTSVVLDALEVRLGFTVDEVRSVYRQGRLSASQGELRARIDARLLALSRAGGEVHTLGRVLGLGMSEGGEGGEFCPAIRNALARARAAEAQS